MTSNNPFGLLAFLHWNHDWNQFHFPGRLRRRAVNQIKDLGVGMIRLDILWADVNAGTRKYDFKKMDEIITEIKDVGIEILGVLQYNKSICEGSTVLWNRPPDSFDEFAAYVQATVERYRDAIHHWEIWNEPNLDVYWNAPKDSLRLYSQLLKKSYHAAKVADPSAIVLNGGLTGDLAIDVKNLYRNVGAKGFDRLNIHLFADPKKPTALDDLRKTLLSVRTVMAEFKDEAKPIWITEVGCPGIPDDKPAQSWFGGEAIRESEQASWVRTVLPALLKEKNVEKVFWAFYRDTGEEFKDATNHFGLVRFDLSQKPAFQELKTLIQKHKTCPA